MPKQSRFVVNIGQRFGRLVVVGLSHKNKHGDFFSVRCDCGTEKTVGRANLFRIQSCGCFKKENIIRVKTTHGFSVDSHPHHYLYDLWTGIKKRCYNKNEKHYFQYGGRGISVFPDWIPDFIKFRDYIIGEIGHRPTPKHSLDRINNDGNYEPGNVRWLDASGQCRNTRKRMVFLYWAGRKISVDDFCKHFGLTKKSVVDFLNKNRKRSWELEGPSASSVSPVVI